MSAVSRIIAAVAVAACVRLFTPTRKATPPITCSAAGKMGAAARKAEDRAPIRAKSRDMCELMGRPVPAILHDEVLV